MDEGTGIKQHKSRESWNTHLLYIPAQVTITKQESVKPSKGCAITACSGECSLVELERRSESSGPDRVGLRAHTGSAAHGATATEQVAVTSMATDLGAGKRAASLSKRRNTGYC